MELAHAGRSTYLLSPSLVILDPAAVLLCYIAIHIESAHMQAWVCGVQSEEEANAAVKPPTSLQQSPST